MDNGLLIAGLIFVLVMLAGFLAFYYSNLYKKRKGISERIRKEAAPEKDEGPSEDSKWKGILLRSVRQFGEVLKPKQETDVSQTRKKLVRAGYQGENGTVVLFGSKAFAALLLLTLAVIIKLAILKALPAQHF